MVKVVVDQMLENDANPTRAMCQSIARSIVRDYPKTFADVRGKKKTLLETAVTLFLSKLKREWNRKIEKTLLHGDAEREGLTLGWQRGPD